MGYLVAGGGHIYVGHASYYASLDSSTCLTTIRVNNTSVSWSVVVINQWKPIHWFTPRTRLMEQFVWLSINMLWVYIFVQSFLKPHLNFTCFHRSTYLLNDFLFYKDISLEPLCYTNNSRNPQWSEVKGPCGSSLNTLKSAVWRPRGLCQGLCVLSFSVAGSWLAGAGGHHWIGGSWPLSPDWIKGCILVAWQLLSLPVSFVRNYISSVTFVKSD